MATLKMGKYHVRPFTSKEKAKKMYMIVEKSKDYGKPKMKKADNIYYVAAIPKKKKKKKKE